MYRRPVAQETNSSAEVVQQSCLGEAKVLYARRQEFWPASIEGVVVEPLTFRDVASFLCEVDKMERGCLHESPVRLYIQAQEEIRARRWSSCFARSKNFDSGGWG